MNVNEVLVVIKTLQISQLLFPWAHDRTAFLFPLERGYDPGICRSRWCVSRVTEALRSSARFPMFSFSCCGDQEHSRDCQLFQPDSKIGWNLEQSPPWSWSGDGARLKTVFIPLKCGLSCCHSRAWTDRCSAIGVLLKMAVNTAGEGCREGHGLAPVATHG